MKFSVTHVQDLVYILTEKIGLPAYDFDFTNQFPCKHPQFWTEEIDAVSRIGATNDYEKRYNDLLSNNIRLIHSPEDYRKTSFLPSWYPLIKEYTPRSIWFDKFPELEDVQRTFSFPIFVKGERQTNRHSRQQSIINNDTEYRWIKTVWDRDPILHWQRVVIREFIKLQSVAPDDGISMIKSFEFRTFWWKNACVSIGNYWTSESYRLNDLDRGKILALGNTVCNKLNVTFLVIDVAKTASGDWIVIEVNDGQDAGYAGNNPFFLWNNILQLEANL